jgi:hypothetical protein
LSELRGKLFKKLFPGLIAPIMPVTRVRPARIDLGPDQLFDEGDFLFSIKARLRVSDVISVVISEVWGPRTPIRTGGQ